MEEGSTIWWTERQPSQVAWSGDEGLVWWRKQRLRGVARRAARQVAKPGANGGSGGAPGGARETRRVRQRHLDAGAALPLNASLAAPPADALAGERDSTKGVEMGSEAVQGGFGEAGPQAAAGETGAAGGEDPEEPPGGGGAGQGDGGGPPRPPPRGDGDQPHAPPRQAGIIDGAEGNAIVEVLSALAKSFEKPLRLPPPPIPTFKDSFQQFPHF